MPVTADSVLEGVMATLVEGLGNGSTRKDIVEKLEIVRDKVFEESPGDPVCPASQPSHSLASAGEALYCLAVDNAWWSISRKGPKSMSPEGTGLLHRPTAPILNL